MSDFDPLHKWLGVPPAKQPPHYYRLLGMQPFEENLDVIEAAAAQRIEYVGREVDGPHGMEAQDLLQKLTRAQSCLLRPEKKAAYDRKLRAKLPPGERHAAESVRHGDQHTQEDIFDPYHVWLGIPPEDQPPEHHRLLGLEPGEADPEVIEAAADLRMAYVQQCATGPHTAESQKILNELSAARTRFLEVHKKTGSENLPNSRPTHERRATREVEAVEKADRELEFRARRDALARISGSPFPSPRPTRSQGSFILQSWRVKRLALGAGGLVLLLLTVVLASTQMSEEETDRNADDEPSRQTPIAQHRSSHYLSLSHRNNRSASPAIATRPNTIQHGFRSPPLRTKTPQPAVAAIPYQKKRVAIPDESGSSPMSSSNQNGNAVSSDDRSTTKPRSTDIEPQDQDNVDLLANIDRVYTRHPNIAIEDKSLRIKAKSRRTTRVPVISFQRPSRAPTEYDLYLTLVRKRLRDGTRGCGLGMVFPVAQGRKGDVYLDGCFGSGIHGLDGRKDYKHPDVHVTGQLFGIEQKCRIKYEVREKRFRAIVDGQAIIDWNGNFTRLPKWRAGRTPYLEVYAHAAHFKITEFRAIPHDRDDSASTPVSDRRKPQTSDTRPMPTAANHQPKKENTTTSATNLLAKIDRRRLRGSDTAFDGNALSIVADRGTTRIKILEFSEPSKVPAEYDLSVSLVREQIPDGTQGLGFGAMFPMPNGRKGDVYLDGYFGSGVFGIDGHDDYKHPDVHVKGDLFKVGRKSTIRYKVRKTGLTVTVDGRTIVDWQDSFDRLPKWPRGTRPYLELRAHTARFRITDFTIAPVKKTLQPETVASDDSNNAPFTPRLLTPKSGASVKNGSRRDQSKTLRWKFEWSDVPNATGYQLVVKHSGASNPVVDTKVRSSEYVHAKKGSFVTDNNRHDWYWRVRAYVNGRWRQWSKARTFNVEPMQ